MKRIVHWFIIIVMMACVLFAFTSCGLLFALDDDDSANNSSNNSSGNSTINNDNNKDNNKTNDVFYIGEPAVNSKGVQFVVVSVRDTNKIGRNTTENNFIVITIRITNNGSESWSQNPLNCTLKLNDMKYEYHSATYSLSDGMSSLDDINPGITKTMSIVFETPSKSSAGNYSLTITNSSIFYLSSVTIVLKNRS